MRPLEVPVFMDDWQIECCQPPPGEGDLVDWPLVWLDDPVGPGALRIAWEAHPPSAGGYVTRADRLLRHGSLTACWRGTSTEPVPAHGRLLADVHGGVPEQVPSVRGTVVSVEVVDQAYRLSGPRSYVPIAGDFRLRRVSRSPKWFSSGARDEDRLPDPVREDSGVLVRLSVGPT